MRLIALRDWIPGGGARVGDVDFVNAGSVFIFDLPICTRTSGQVGCTDL